jgi:hypothetical protein
MKKAILVTVVLLAGFLAVGILGFYLGTQAASDYWLRQYLRQVAWDVWMLEKAKPGIDASPDMAQWYQQEIRNAERVLAHQEFAEIVEHDQMIQRLRARVAELRDGAKAINPQSRGSDQEGR